MHGDGGAKRISAAQELVAEVLDESLLSDSAFAFDGRLTSIEAIPVEMREPVLAEFHKDQRFVNFIGPAVVGVLNLYPEAPGRWLLVDPWLEANDIPSPEDALDLLRDGIVTAVMDRHQNALVKSPTVGWRLIGRSMSFHDPKTLEALEGWPAVDEKRARGDAVVLSMFLICKQPPEDRKAEIERARISWARQFWNTNWRLSPCLLPIEDTDASEPPPEEDEAASPSVESLREACNRLEDELDDENEQFLSEAFNRDLAVDLHNPARHEVVCGLVKRLYRQARKLLLFPELWSSDSAANIMRTYAETVICLRWMSLQPADSGFEKYKDYGLGRRVLMRKLMEQMLDEVPEEGRAAFDRVLGVLEARTGGEWSEQFLEISVESTFAGVSLRSMAEESATLDLYRHVFQTSSGVMHGEWWAIEDYELTRCVESLHRFHLIPTVVDNVDPTLDFDSHLVDRFREVALLGLSILADVAPD